MKYKEKERAIEELAERVIESIYPLNIQYNWYDDGITSIYYRDDDYEVDGYIKATAQCKYYPSTYYSPEETYLVGLDVIADGEVLYKDKEVDPKLSDYLFNIIQSYISENYKEYE